MGTSVNIFRNTNSSSSSGGGKEEQTKSVTITENGTTTVTPDEGKTLARVNVTTSVNPVAKRLYWKEEEYPGSEWYNETFYENLGGVWYCLINNNSDRLIVVTTDENEPDDDGSNILMSMSVKAGSSATIKMRFEINEEIVIAEIRILTITPK